MKETEVEFNSGSLALAGGLAFPDRDGAAPVVILVPGSGHHDRDQTVCGHKPFLVLARHLAQHGIGSLRFDCRGVGASSGSIESASFTTKVSDLLAARSFLLTSHRANEAGLAYIGHSEGGLVAAAVSAQCSEPVAMLAGPAAPIVETLHALARNQSLEGGASNRQISHERKMNDQVFAILCSAESYEAATEKVRHAIRAALRSWPDLVWDSEDQIAEASEAMAHIVMAEDYRSFVQQDPAAILSNVKAPILALYGAIDRQVEADPNKHAFEMATAGNASAQAKILPRHNHLFQIAMTGHIDEYEELGQSPSLEALDCITDWLRSSLYLPGRWRG